MSITIHDPWSGESGTFADQAHVEERPTHSKLLGPDGKPLAYEKPRIGFDLRPSRKDAP